MEIAKFRSARVLWSKVVEAFGGSDEARKIKLHLRTGLHNKTIRDPYVNMLRTSMEALSGAIAGTDSLCVGNFDETIRLPESFSRRIARNTHLILQEECELTNVVDPAGGSWAVETLTDNLAASAWEIFQQIEAGGGMLNMLLSGAFQEELKELEGI